MPKLKTKDGKWKGVEFENLDEDTKNILKEWGYLDEIQEREQPNNLQNSEAGRRVRGEQGGGRAFVAPSTGSKTESET